MRIVIAIGILLLATAALAGSSDWDGQRPVPSIPYSFTPNGADNPTNVAIFRDQMPWGMTTDDDILVANGIAFTVFGSGDIGSVDLSPFDKIIISNQQPLTFNNAVSANAAWFDAFVDAGGILLLGLAHYSVDLPEGLSMPGGYNLAVTEANNFVTIVDPGHELFTIPNLVGEEELESWSFSSHGDLNTPLGSMALVMNAEFSSGPALAEMPLGNGWIIATTQPYQWSGASYIFSENLLLYLPEGVVAIEPTTLGAVKCLFR